MDDLRQSYQRIALTEQDVKKNDRLNFIRKVYGILSLQLIITASSVAAVKLIPGWNETMKGLSWLSVLAAIIAIIVECCILCFRKFSRTVPINYYLLATFTACQSFCVAHICSFYETSVALTVAGMTTAITLVITCYALTTEVDFTTFEMFCPILIANMTCLLFCSFFMTFSSWWHPVYAGILVVMYGLYLVHDTQLIAGDKKYALGYDDYIIGALIIYIDIVMLFLELLKVFGDKK